MSKDKEKGKSEREENDVVLKELFVKTGRFLRNHMLWISRILAFLGVLSILLDFIGLNLWKFLGIETPELTISVSLLFFWFSIEVINKVPELIKHSLSELVSQFYILLKYSPEIDDKIKDKIKKYEIVDIFAYSAETLPQYLPQPLTYVGKDKKIRVLARNWYIEEKDQNKWNADKGLLNSEKKWNKAEKIKNGAAYLNSNFRRLEINIEQKFYDEAPLFRCYLFGNKHIKEDTEYIEYIEAYVGIYEWQKNPVKGSPYKGIDRPLFHIKNERTVEKQMLDIIVSRFNHCWEYVHHMTF